MIDLIETIKGPIVKMGPFLSLFFSRRPYAAHRSSLYAVQLKAFEPWPSLVSYAGLVIKQHSAERDIHFPYR
jgi:hypothetical protein